MTQEIIKENTGVKISGYFLRGSVYRREGYRKNKRVTEREIKRDRVRKD